MSHPAVLPKILKVSALLLNDTLKMCCYKSRLVFSCCF